MDEPQISNLARIEWEGDSKEVLSGFPSQIRSTFGFSLWQIQTGLQPQCPHRPMTSVGKGVWELKQSDSRTWYRVMYLTRIDNVIYLLHSFEKNTRKTDRRDIETAKARLSAVRRHLNHEAVKE